MDQISFPNKLLELKSFNFLSNHYLVSKVTTDCKRNDVVTSFNLDSRKLHQFIIEDLMFANPDTHERILFLLLAKILQ
jgi:hypothetical protein